MQQTKEFADKIVSRTFPDLDVPCLECGKSPLKQTDGLFECKDPDCSFRIKKHIAGHELSENEAIELLTNKKVGPIHNFKNRFGQPFEAELVIAKEKRTWKVSFQFEGDDRREEELKELTDEQVICQARKSDDTEELVRVYENSKAFRAGYGQ